MANDQYIKHIMQKVRMDVGSATVSKNGNATKDQRKRTNAQISPIKSMLSLARKYEIMGDKKRLIKMDRKNEEILKVLYPVFGVDVTRFINLLVAKFIQENPELVQEIKNSIRKL